MTARAETVATEAPSWTSLGGSPRISIIGVIIDEGDETKANSVVIAQNQASMFSSMVNLFKNIVGTSMLAMPYGIACCGILPSIFLAMLLAVLSSFTFTLLGSLCASLSQKTYRGICESYISPRAGIYAELLLAMYTFPSCIAYVVFVIFCVLKMLPDDSSVYCTRWFVGLCLTVFVLLPLCCVSKIDSLTYTSFLGVLATIYCYVFVSVDLAQNSDVIDQNVAGTFWGPPSGSLLGVFPMANILAALYLVHYNAPTFYNELANNTHRRFSILSYTIMCLSGIFCISFAILGFARWGVIVPQNLLLEYTGAYPVWIATCVSVLTTYPLVFEAGRRSLLSVCESVFPRISARKIYWTSTFVLVPFFSMVGVFVTNLAVVVGINGALCGLTVGFTLPGYLLVCWAKKNDANWTQIATGWALVAFGVSMSTLGLISLFIDLAPRH